MKKRVIIVLSIVFLLVILLVLLICSQTREIKKFREASDITMEIKEGTLTDKGATIIITDKTGEDNIYGEWYRIDKFIDGKWYELLGIINDNIGWNAMGYTLNEDRTLTMDVNWEHLYGELEAGKYRIVKEINNEYIAAEFEIKD